MDMVHTIEEGGIKEGDGRDDTPGFIIVAPGGNLSAVYRIGNWSESSSRKIPNAKGLGKEHGEENDVSVESIFHGPRSTTVTYSCERGKRKIVFLWR